MIRYPVTHSELEEKIKAGVPTWMTRASERTETFRTLGRYEETSSIWSEIKTVFMEIQHDKCAYCERQLEGQPYGTIEYDLEHYRPKSSVKKWPPRRWPPKTIGEQGKLSYRFTTGDLWDEGYYLLAYNILNYAVACKVCNSVLKSNYFPIYGPRGQQSDNPSELADELPLLIFPIGELDKDPEDLLTFNGIVPIPKHSSEYQSYRARVTIDFFVLEKREHLREQRANQIELLWFGLLGLSAPDPDDRNYAQARIDQLLSPSSPHCSCVRAFYSLYQQDPESAREVYMGVREYLMSRSRKHNVVELVSR